MGTSANRCGIGMEGQKMGNDVFLLQGFAPGGGNEEGWVEEKKRRGRASPNGVQKGGLYQRGIVKTPC